MEFLNKPISRWWVVIGGMLGSAASVVVITDYAFGVFIKAIASDFGWGRGTVTLGISCFLVACGLGAVALGSIMSRWGVRRTAIVFVASFCVALGFVSCLPNSVLLFCLVLTIAGFFSSGATIIPYATAICAYFDEKRGLALGLVVGGTGFGASTMGFYANYLLSHYGWRGGFFGIALFAAILGIVPLIFFVRMPSYKSVRSGQGEMSVGADGPGIVRLFRNSRPFALIGFPIFGIGVAITVVLGNLVPILTDRGMSMTTAVKILSVLGTSSWVSRYIVGYLLDKVFAPYLSAAMMILAVVGMAVIGLGVSGLPTYLGAGCVGLTVGSESDLMSYMVSRYFPPRAFSKIVGVLWLLITWGGAVGYVFGGYSYDLLGSYDVVIWLSVLIAAACAAGPLFLGPYAFPRTKLAVAASSPSAS